MSILRELKRRKVFQVATVYAVVAWILVEIVTTIEEPLGLPAWVDTFVIVCLGIGFPVALILSWAFDVTPDGIQVTSKVESGTVAPSAPVITVVMQGLVLLAVSFLLLDRYWLSDITANDRTGPVDDTGVTRFSIPYSLADSEFQVSFGRSAAVSPDGRTVLIGRPEGLVVRPVSSLNERAIAESGRLNSLAISPDGRSVAYWETSTQQIKRVEISGGSPAIVGTSHARVPNGVSWEVDGAIWFAAPGGIYRVPAEGNDASELVIAVDEDMQAIGPTLLPDRDSVLFSLSKPGEWDRGEIVVETLSTNVRKSVLAGGSNARYLATGHLVYALGSTIYARQFDVDSLTASGEAIPVVEDVVRADMVWQTGIAQFDVSLNGTLVYVKASRNRSRSLVWVDRDGRETALGMEPGDYDLRGLSPQQTHVLLRMARPDNTIKIWDLENASMTHLMFGPAGADSPVWMPDGEHIAFHPGTGPVIELRTSNNVGDPRRIVTGYPGALDPFHPMQVLPSGKEIIIEGRATPATRLDVGMTTIDGNGDVEWLLQSEAAETNPVVSPDGRWIAYESNESGQNEIFVRPFPNVEGGRWRISNRGGTRPVWASGSDELYYIESGQIDRMMVVDIDASESELSFSNRRRVMDWPYASTSGGNFDISADGQRFIALKPLTDENVVPEIVVVQNWFEELREQVPVN